MKSLTFSKIIFQILILFSIFSESASSQPTALLEACNAVEDKEKRLECFKELSSVSRQPAAANTNDTSRIANAFSAVAGAVSSGVSFNNYTSLLLEPARELEIFKQTKPAPDQRIIDLYNESLIAYKDAERVWYASIYKSEDGGLFVGKVLDPRRAGLVDLVAKYNLPTTSVLLSINLPSDLALNIIWTQAKLKAQEANELIRNPAALTKDNGSIISLDSESFYWPATGSIISKFGEKNKGLSIEGRLGDPVRASRSGVVVFSSNRLSGYGNLIIIKHDNIYLTAYAHNSELLVREGERVQRGQTIAKMGSTETDQVKLHFEIRKHGTAVDPIPYLKTPESTNSSLTGQQTQ